MSNNVKKEGKRQDYVARIRYQNDLPPPPCPPKLMDIPIDTKQLMTSHLLSDSLRKRKMNMQIDSDFGMPIDLIEIPGIFYDGDESGIYPENVDDDQPAGKHLDPKDRALIHDPSGKTGAARTSSNVAFLRRTEYISSETIRSKQTAESKAAALAKQQKDETINPDNILRTVESTFDTANTNILNLKHPRKKHLKPVKSWAMLPDTKLFDMQYVTVRMVGSASLSNHKRKFSDAELSTALFKQSTVDGDEWMSFYVAEEKAAQELHDLVKSNVDTMEEDSNQYRFTRIQDNDVVLENKRPEIALTFSDEAQQALYVNVAGQASLKRRRVVKHRRDAVNEKNVAQIDFSLREYTTTESNARDEQRAEFDPVNYGTE